VIVTSNERAAAIAQWERAALPTLFSTLQTSAAGLTGSAAAARLRVQGLNLIERRSRHPVALEFLLRFRNPLVLLLIASSVVLGFTGDAASTAIIVFMVVASVTLDFVQEHRAERAVERLQATIAATARVLRDGVRHEVHVADLVPGDVVLVAAGDVVPADGRVLAADHLLVNEAALTGESFPVERRAPAAPDDAGSVLRMGTAVVNGSASLLVCATGNATAIGSVAGMLEQGPEQPLERGLREFGVMILRLTLLLVLFVVLVNALLHRPLVESLLFAVALAVGLTPELLPMIVSVTLAHGALRLAKKHVIVKRLAAIYALGGMDVLCTDKTGTLTEARISVAGHVDGHNTSSRRVLELACANARFASGVRSPLDEALLAAREPAKERWTKLAEVPFDFERRRVSVLLEDPGGERIIVVKGAPEDVLTRCVAEQTATAATSPLDAAARARLERAFVSFGEQGLRVLALAVRAVGSDRTDIRATDEEGLTFAGFVTFADPPRHDAASALAGLAHAGIELKILTGDNERVARHLCETLGLPVHGALSGLDVARLGDEALAAAVARTTLFCRVGPDQKTRVIRALRQRGRVVGFMGDGINDAPALSAADVGISVQHAVGVAREAASIILTRGHLAVVREGVLEGRRTYANIMKYLMMATSSNFGNMLSMALATLVLPFLPLLPVQILLNNLLYDISEIAIPLDRVDEAELRRPRVWDMAQLRRFMLVFGPISSLFDLLTFGVLIVLLNADAAMFRTGWFIESLATQLLVIFVIRTRRPFTASRPHPLLAAMSLAMVAVAFVLPFTPAGRLVGFVAPPLPYLALLALLVVLYLLLAEYGKHWFFGAQHALIARHTRRAAVP
jgi:Mg2+-importing ATPase